MVYGRYMSGFSLDTPRGHSLIESIYLILQKPYAYTRAHISQPHGDMQHAYMGFRVHAMRRRKSLHSLLTSRVLSGCTIPLHIMYIRTVPSASQVVYICMLHTYFSMVICNCESAVLCVWTFWIWIPRTVYSHMHKWDFTYVEWHTCDLRECLRV